MPSPYRPTPYERHAVHWRDCTACPLHAGRRNVVLARGDLPCDVLLVGEAPGESEDALGRPFCGPAGHLLDRVLRDAWAEPGPEDDWHLPFRVAFANLVACVPREPGGTKAVEPPRECVQACAPRLKEFVRLARPRLLVRVGALARRNLPGPSVFLDRGEPGPPWLPEGRPLAFCDVDHPAYVLRANVAQRGLLTQRCVVTLRDAGEALREEDLKWGTS